MSDPGARRRLAALALGFATCVAHADSPSWGYLEYDHGWAKLQEDLSGEGDGLSLSLPLGAQWFAVGSASEAEARYDDPMIPDVERRETWSAGLGVHSGEGKGQVHAELSYVRHRRTSTAPGFPTFEEEREGTVFAMGYRRLQRPWLMLEPEFGLGHYGRTLDFETYARFKVAARVVPRVWLVASYSSGLTPLDDGSVLALGARFTWRDSVPERKVPPAVRAASGDAAVLAPGGEVVALRALQLQQQPAFGARETVVVPEGATLRLLETLQNGFGAWWRVAHGDQQGWIREGHLR